MALWACCLFPSLSLEVFEPAPSAFVVYDGPTQRAFVHLANPAAAALGIRTGQTLAAARALCAGLEAQRRDAAAETARLQTLALLAYAHSSQVVPLPPDALLLEVGASLRLFGGWPAIRDALRTRITALGHELRIALAPTPLAARLLAACHDGCAVATLPRLQQRLAPVPVTQAHLQPAALALLQSIGVRTLGEARALPSAALARRAGRELVTHLAQLYGEAPDPRPLWQPPSRFELRCEFEYGIETSPALRFPLQRLTGELARHLQARDAAVLRFELRFGHEGCAPSRMAVGLRTPLRQAEALFDAARNRLEQHALAAPAHWLALLAEDLPQFAPRNPDLFDASSRGALDWESLVERLRARLGDESVNTVSPWPDHRPEFAWRRGEAHEGESAWPVARPLWLLPQPQPLRARVRCLFEGVERIESGWWDGADARRDYRIAELDSGQRAWLYRPSGAGDEAPWLVHGWYG